MCMWRVLSWLTVRYDAGGHALVLYRLLPLELGDTFEKRLCGDGAVFMWSPAVGLNAYR